MACGFACDTTVSILWSLVNHAANSFNVGEKEFALSFTGGMDTFTDLQNIFFIIILSFCGYMKICGYIFSSSKSAIGLLPGLN